MYYKNLVDDYLLRSKLRLKALDLLFSEADYAKVVVEPQEIVEFVIKALL